VRFFEKLYLGLHDNSTWKKKSKTYEKPGPNHEEIV